MYKIRAAAKRRGDEGSSETLENMTTCRTIVGRQPDGSAAPFCESSLEPLSMDVRPGARPILSQVRFRHVLDIARSVIGHRHPPGHTGPKQRAVVTSLKTCSYPHPASDSAIARPSGCAAASVLRHQHRGRVVPVEARLGRWCCCG